MESSVYGGWYSEGTRSPENTVETSTPVNKKREKVLIKLGEGVFIIYKIIIVLITKIILKNPLYNRF